MKLSACQPGFTLIEVLVTLVIVALGLLGLGALQVNTMNNSFETYQRALVTAIVEDMAARIRMNHRSALTGSYELALDSSPCSDDPLSLTTVQADICAWKTQIDGGIEVASESRRVGAPMGARGCIERLPSNGGGTWIRVSVAWVGITPQSETAATCGADEMGDEAYRRVVFRDVAVR